MAVSSNFSYGTYCPGFNPSHVNWSNFSHDNMSWGAEESDASWTEVRNETCNCTTWNLDTKDATPIAIIRIITSFFSVIGAASIILLVLLTGKLNTAEVHPLFILSVADFILAILWLIGGVVWLSPDAHGWARNESASHAGMCYVLAEATTMAGLVTFFLTVVYAQSALLRVREIYVNKGKTLGEKDRKKHIRYIVTGVSYVLSWLLPLLIVLPVTEKEVGIDMTNRGCWCIIDFFNLRPDDGVIERNSPFNHFAIVQSSILGPIFVFTTGQIIVYYIITFFYARKVAKMHNYQRQGKSQKMIKAVMIRLSLFVLIFVICGAPTFAGAIAVWAEHDRLHIYETPDRVILYLHALTAPMQGFFNAVVYGWSRQEFRKAVKIQQRIKFSAGRQQTPRYESLNNSRVSPGNLNYNANST